MEAVKVTGVPWQNGLLDAVMEIPTGNPVLALIVIALDVTGLPLTQVAFENSVQVTTCPLRGQ